LDDGVAGQLVDERKGEKFRGKMVIFQVGKVEQAARD
jgi:hypothetical protein